MLTPVFLCFFVRCVPLYHSLMCTTFIDCCLDMNADDVMLSPNGVHISDKKEIAQQFNNLFVNIGGKLAETILPKHQTKPFDSYLKDRCNSTFNFVPVTRDEVISVIHNFAAKKSAGHDLISTHLLKEISLLIAEPLSLIINQSLCSGIFPSKLKIA